MRSEVQTMRSEVQTMIRPWNPGIPGPEQEWPPVEILWKSTDSGIHAWIVTCNAQ